MPVLNYLKKDPRPVQHMDANSTIMSSKSIAPDDHVPDKTLTPDNDLSFRKDLTDQVRRHWRGPNITPSEGD